MKLNAEYVLRDKDKEIAWLRQRVTELEDRLMVMADKPWTLPPAEMVETPKDEDENGDGWVSDPSQVIEETVTRADLEELVDFHLAG